MKHEYTDQAELWYQLAEQKAARYFTSLYEHVTEKSYVPVLTEDFQVWRKNHVKGHSWLSYFSRKRKPDSQNDQRYIKWLNYTGKLDDYLDRSISYIYLRDLGKLLDSPGTQTRIHHVVADIKDHLIRSTNGNGAAFDEDMSLARVYRWAQKESIESAVIWLIEKLKAVSTNIPQGMNAEHAQRKLIKIIIGVVFHVMEEMDEDISPAERAVRLDVAIRLGYSYGLTYPFIDDLLDSGILTPAEKAQYTDLIRTALLTGIVPELKDWTGTTLDMIKYVHSELRDAFEYIRNHQRPDTLSLFYEQSYVFFQSQELDRVKDLTKADYTNEELYIPVIIKSSSSRLIIRSIISAPKDEGFDDRAFYFGIYNQLADDFADMFDDMKEGAVTPYTYYLKYHKVRKDLINPFELYWAVISHLIHNVYQSDAKSREVILDRVINGLKRCKVRVGLDKYNEIMNLFAYGNPEFNHLVQQMVQKADDVDFFDKLLRDRMVITLRNHEKDKDDFLETVKNIRNQINSQLLIHQPEGIPPLQETLMEAANYSLEGDGKRLRPILAWVMGVNEFGLKPSEVMPLLKALEYLHTASLIFDDLPSQDNAATRRGRATLHQVYDSATAELTGLYLIQKAIGEQASLHTFEAKIVLVLIQYSAQKAEEACMGQAMDLHSRGQTLTLEQLNKICFYKTGTAFEASLVMPAILAGVKTPEIEALKKYAYHAGIAFQIKDDLLDAEGDQQVLGKPVRQDAENNNSTFVSTLGLEGARQEMWEHYCLATDALMPMSCNTTFLKYLLNVMVNRDR
ncbi:polyprenyl synthetase family protein [Paenibacillus sp. sgz500958]|uniref:polyprenyl synthetase family protein n=1 Tax=Paenibacillus sp. sgz500958 TaxID=3242475 RepID=UPI0036D3C840